MKGKEHEPMRVTPSQGPTMRMPPSTRSRDVRQASATVLRHMPVQTGSPTPDERTVSAGGSRPAKGSTGLAAMGRSSEAMTGQVEMVGQRSVYVLARDNDTAVETPMFAGATEQDAGALAVFTTAETAADYLQTARWGDKYRAVALSALELPRWLEQARAQGVDAVLVDPNRHTQEHGDAQAALSLSTLRHFSGEGLYDEIWALGNP